MSEISDFTSPYCGREETAVGKGVTSPSWHFHPVDPVRLVRLIGIAPYWSRG